MDNSQDDPAAAVDSTGSFEFRIDNAISDWTRKESAVFGVGGLQWSLLVRRGKNKNESEHLGCHLQYHKKMENRLWSCKVTVELSVLSSIDSRSAVRSFSTQFSGSQHSCGEEEMLEWSDVLDEQNGYLDDGAITVRVQLDITSSIGIFLKLRSDFDAPSRYSDGVLIVEDKPVHVSKAILAANSRYFNRLFYGTFGDADEAEIDLPDIVHGEFVDFLKVIYPERKKVNEHNVGYLLKLADRLYCNMVLRKCTKYLLTSKEVPISTKLLYAEKYHLAELLEACFGELTSRASLSDLAKAADFDAYGDVLLKMIYIKLAEAK